MRITAAVAVIAVACFAAVVGAAPARAVDQGDAVGASVPPGSLTPPNARFYLLPLRPGQNVTQTLHLQNPNDHAVNVVIEPVDAGTNSITGVRYGTPGSPKALTSRWVVVSTPQVTLQAGEERNVLFTVQVPSGVKPGQYLAGLSASVPVTPDTSGVAAPPRGGAAFAMALQLQRAIAVEVDVPGPRAPKLVVTGATASASPAGNGVDLGIHIANTGNAFAHGTGVIRVADTNTDFPFKIDTFVPGTSIVYPVTWTKTIVAGDHHIEVDLTYEGGQHTSWTGTVDIAGALKDKLEHSLQQVQVHNAKKGVNFWLVLGGLLMLGLAGGAITMRRRSRRPPYVKYRAA